MGKKYTISDGKMLLFLEPAEKGWYAVTSPLDPGLITQARTIEEAFVMAYDAQKCLKAARAKLARQLGTAGPARERPAKRAARRASTLAPRGTTVAASTSVESSSTGES